VVGSVGEVGRCTACRCAVQVVVGCGSVRGVGCGACVVVGAAARKGVGVEG